MTEATIRCVSMFITNLQDTASVARVQEYQAEQRGECKTWKEARDLIDDIPPKNLLAANLQMRYWSSEYTDQEYAESDVRNVFTPTQSATPHQQEESYYYTTEDTLHERSTKCLEFKDSHNPCYCKLAGKSPNATSAV